MSRFLRAIPVVTCLGAIVAASAAAVPGPATGRSAEPIAAKLPVSSTNLVCPPPPVLSNAAAEAGVDAGFAAQPVKPVEALTAFTYAEAGSPSTLAARTLPAEGQPSQLQASEAGPLSLLSKAPAEPLSLSAKPSGSNASAIGALTSTLTSEGDLSGLAISSCTPPSSTGWLVGGALTVGRTTRVVLSNPGPTASSVSLQVLTTAGLKAPAAGEDILVPSGQSRELLVSALVEGSGPTAIGFTADGGPVAASLVDTDLAGITPRGVEQVQPSTPATTSLLGPVTADYGASTLRLANPTNKPVEVTWQAVGPDKPLTLGGESSATLAPGALQEFPVELPKTAVGLQVSAEKAVLASVVITRERDSDAGKQADFAVLTPSAPLAGVNLVAAAPGTGRIGLIAGEQPATIGVRAVDGDGKAVTDDQTIALTPRAGKIIEAPEGATAVQLRVRGGQVYGGEVVFASGEAFLAGTQIVPAPTVQRSVPVELTQ